MGGGPYRLSGNGGSILGAGIQLYMEESRLYGRSVDGGDPWYSQGAWRSRTGGWCRWMAEP